MKNKKTTQFTILSTIKLSLYHYLLHQSCKDPKASLHTKGTYSTRQVSALSVAVWAGPVGGLFKPCRCCSKVKRHLPSQMDLLLNLLMSAAL